VRLAWLALGLTGCSIFFNPDNARPPPCPISAGRCPAEPNAIASCLDGGGCGYTCDAGWVDDDGDLGAAGSNGCETPCVACTPAPSSLEAVVGPTSGGIQLLWPDVDAGTRESARITTYRVYSSVLPQAMEIARAACDAGVCTALVPGLLNNTRYSFQVRSVDLYQNESDAGLAPSVSATPINGTGASIDGWTLGNPCAHGFIADGGVFEIDTDLLCITTAYAGDGLWSDYTLDVDLNISPGAFNASTVTGGPILWSDGGSSSPVLSATALPCAAQLDASSDFRLGFTPLAGAVECAPLQAWFPVRVVAQANLASYQVGVGGGPLQEVARFRYPFPGATGRIGLGAGAFALGGAVQFRNLRVSTRPQLPTGGPTSLHLDFASIPSTAHVLGTGTTHSGGCPTLTGADGCDAGECPAPGAGCLFVSVSDGGEAGLAFDLPVGIDPGQSYEVRFGYAPLAPAGQPDILRDPSADLLATGDGGVLMWLGQALNAGAAVGQWNAVDVLVAPDAGTVSLRWNGQPAVVGLISLDAGTLDLTPLILGTGGGPPMNGVYTPVDVIAR
jgi:hypothetical protein